MLRIVTALLIVATITPITKAGCKAASARKARRVRVATCQAQPYGYALPYVVAAPVAYLPTPSVAPTPQAVEAPPSPQAIPALTPYGDPYGFGLMLNEQRAKYYRKQLRYDPALSALAAANSSKGWGHHGFHKGRENVGMGSLDVVMASWLASPAHADALLDPGLSRYGIANVGGVWTYVAH